MAGDAVPEGNRRLAALRILSNETLRGRLRIGLPFEPNSKALPESVRVRAASDPEARDFSGFKHINGTFKWDALARGKYAADWFAEDGDIGRVSRRLGDNRHTVVRLAGMSRFRATMPVSRNDQAIIPLFASSAASPNAPPSSILDGWSANVDDSQRRRAFATRRPRNAATSPGFIVQRAITSMATISAEFTPVRVAASADLDEAVRLVLACPQGPLAAGDGRRNSSQWSCRNSMETSAVARVSGSRAARRFVGGVRSPNSAGRFRKAAEFPGC